MAETGVVARIVGAPASATRDQRDCWLVLGVFFYLYANLFVDPRTPILLGGDQLYFWMDAQRMLNGEHVYRDFFQFTPPGTDWMYLVVFRLLGPRIWVANLVVLMLGTLLCWVCLQMSRSIASWPQAALATALFLICIFGRLLNGTHHFFSVLAVMSAVLILLKGTDRAGVAISGAVLGVAAFFTQTHAAVAALAIAIWLAMEGFRNHESWSERCNKQLLLFAPMAALFLLLDSYYIATVGLKELTYFMVTYPRSYMGGEWYGPLTHLPRHLSFSNLTETFQLLAAYVIFAPVYALSLHKSLGALRRCHPVSAARVTLIALVGLALLLEVAQSPSWFRFYCVAAPAIILFAWLIDGAGQFELHAVRLVWVAVICIAAHDTWSRHAAYTVVESLPGGRLATTALAAEKLSWLAAHTQANEFVLQAAWPGVYLPLAVRNPLYLEDLETGGQRQLGYVDLSMQQLTAKHVRLVLWSPALNSPTFALEPLREYIGKRYRRTWVFSDKDEVWEINP